MKLWKGEVADPLIFEHLTRQNHVVECVTTDSTIAVSVVDESTRIAFVNVESPETCSLYVWTSEELFHENRTAPVGTSEKGIGVNRTVVAGGGIGMVVKTGTTDHAP